MLMLTHAQACSKHCIFSLLVRCQEYKIIMHCIVSGTEIIFQDAKICSMVTSPLVQRCSQLVKIFPSSRWVTVSWWVGLSKWHECTYRSKICPCVAFPMGGDAQNLNIIVRLYPVDAENFIQICSRVTLLSVTVQMAAISLPVRCRW